MGPQSNGFAGLGLAAVGAKGPKISRGSTPPRFPPLSAVPGGRSPPAAFPFSPPITPTPTTANPKLADTLTEPALFINDRIAGYQTATRETNDPQNLAHYQQLVQQSEQFGADLNRFARAAGGAAEASTTLKGKLYLGFIDAKALLTGRSKGSILDSNIYD